MPCMCPSPRAPQPERALRPPPQPECALRPPRPERALRPVSPQPECALHPPHPPGVSVPFALLLSALSSHCYLHLSVSSLGLWVLPDSWFCPYPFPSRSRQDPLWVQTSLSSLPPSGHLGASSGSWSFQVLCLPAPCPPTPSWSFNTLPLGHAAPSGGGVGGAVPRACLSPY